MRTTPLNLALLLCLSLVFLSEIHSASAGEERRTDASGREYWLYTPTRIDPTTTYWVVVGVHGARKNGKGASGLSGWSERGNCLVVGPSFDINGGFQGLGGGSDAQLIGIFKALQQEYKVHDRMFLFGHSAGSQYVHRFMLKYPELTIGCTASAGGSWGTGHQDPSYLTEGGPGKPREARDIPLVVTCGENDTGTATPMSPMGRFEWAQLFVRQAREAGLFVYHEWIPGKGHGGAKKRALVLAVPCFELATTTWPPLRQHLAETEALLGENPGAESLAVAWQAATDECRRPAGSGPLLEAAWQRYVERLEGLRLAIDEAGVAAIDKAAAVAVAAGSDDARRHAVAAITAIGRALRRAEKTTARSREAIRRLNGGAPDEAGAPTGSEGESESKPGKYPRGTSEFDTFLSHATQVMPAGHRALRNAGSVTEAIDGLNDSLREKLSRLLDHLARRAEGDERTLLREFRRMLRE